MRIRTWKKKEEPRKPLQPPDDYLERIFVASEYPIGRKFEFCGREMVVVNHIALAPDWFLEDGMWGPREVSPKLVCCYSDRQGTIQFFIFESPQFKGILLAK